MFFNKAFNTFFLSVLMIVNGLKEPHSSCKAGNTIIRREADKWVCGPLNCPLSSVNCTIWDRKDTATFKNSRNYLCHYKEGSTWKTVEGSETVEEFRNTAETINFTDDTFALLNTVETTTAETEPDETEPTETEPTETEPDETKKVSLFSLRGILNLFIKFIRFIFGY